MTRVGSPGFSRRIVERVGNEPNYADIFDESTCLVWHVATAALLHLC